VVSFTPRPLYSLGKSPWYPLDKRLGGPQSRSGRGDEKKNSQLPPGIETAVTRVQDVSCFVVHVANCKYLGTTVPNQIAITKKLRAD
jgi:hypothetical protein